MRVYLDSNATAPLRASCAQLLSLWGNASAIHGSGRATRCLIEQARGVVGSALKINPSLLTFTSGATESNNTIIKRYPGPVIASHLEHPSVLQARNDLHIAPVLPDGAIDLSALDAILREISTPSIQPLVTLIAAHNETGVIQPVSETIKIVKRHRARIHIDAVQAFTRLDLPYELCDYITISGHKIGAFSGIGALYVAEQAPFTPLIQGGGQQRSMRGGTENLIGILSFEAAVRDALHDRWSEIHLWRDELENNILKNNPDTIIIAQSSERLANTSLIAHPHFSSSTLIMKLDLMGFEVSSGSACSSGKVRTSPALQAMNIDPGIADRVVRISAPYNITHSEYMRFSNIWNSI